MIFYSFITALLVSPILTEAAGPGWYNEFQRQVGRRLSERTLVDSLTKPISISGAHAFIAPNFEKGDERGPCPGLNALANHGYIPRDGVVSLVDVVSGVNEVYGMGVDLATILAVMGTIFCGNPLSLNPGFSIGGSSNKNSNMLHNLAGLLGTPRGLNASHNFIEADSSNTRDDLYVTGDAWTLNLDLFTEAYYSSGTDSFTFDQIGERAAYRWQTSKATNPTFYYGPYSGMVVRNAGYAFASRLLSNHTTKNPEGLMTKSVLRSFFAVSGEDGSFKYNYGWERIPENWYKTSVDYNLLSLNRDLITWMMKFPQLASIGGNTGTINSFVGLDISNITGGILNSATLLENNNLMCFVLTAVKTFAPNLLSPLFATLATPVSFLFDAINVPLLNLACPAFIDLESGGSPLWETLLSNFPGARRAGSAL